MKEKVPEMCSKIASDLETYAGSIEGGIFYVEGQFSRILILNYH